MSTLSGQTIQSTYPSLLKVNNYTGSSTSEEYITDGLGRQLPIKLSLQRTRFEQRVDFRDCVDVIYSGAPVNFTNSIINFAGSVPNFTGANFALSGASMNFTNANTIGVVRSVSVQKAGAPTGTTDNLVFSAGTSLNVEYSANTLTITYTGSTGSTEASGNIIKVGTGTTTANTIYYWDGTNWQTPVNASNSYNKLLGIAKGTNPAVDGMYISGIITGITSYSAGSLWLDETSGFTTTQPYTDGVAIRGVGHSLGSSGIVFQPDVWYLFNDSTNYLETHLGEVLITNDGFALEYT